MSKDLVVIARASAAASSTEALAAELSAAATRMTALIDRKSDRG